MSDIEELLKRLLLENLLLKSKAYAILGMHVKGYRDRGWTYDFANKHVNDFVVGYTEFWLEKEPAISVEEREKILAEIQKEKY